MLGKKIQQLAASLQFENILLNIQQTQLILKKNLNKAKQQ